MRRQSSVQLGLVGVLTGVLMMFAPGAFADDSAQLKEQIQALQSRVDQLETELANKQQPASQHPSAVYDQYQWEDPFTQIMRINDQMERNMRQAFTNPAIAFSPKMDMKQTDKEYIITMDIPGMDDKISVEIKQGMLMISGERQSETQDNSYNQYYRQERSFGTFMQAVPLPKDAKKDQVEARYKNGVLTVIVAREKKEEKKSEEQKIMVK